MSKGRTARRDRRRSVAGRYELVAPAGRDTLGLVWMGNDLLLRREVMVHEVMAGDRLLPEERAGFHRQVAREARPVSRINHPGVMTPLDVVEEPGRTFVITERADGRTLDR